MARLRRRARPPLPARRRHPRRGRLAASTARRSVATAVADETTAAARARAATRGSPGATRPSSRIVELSLRRATPEPAGRCRSDSRSPCPGEGSASTSCSSSAASRRAARRRRRSSSPASFPGFESRASRSTRRRARRSSGRRRTSRAAATSSRTRSTRSASTSRGRDCLDVGASTGGFTDVLLQRGAARVIALDVGYGQLHPRLRDDPRVTVLERTNVARADVDLPFAPDLVVCDVSFISVRTALPPALASPRRAGRRSCSSSRSSRPGARTWQGRRRPRPGGAPARAQEVAEAALAWEPRRPGS